MRETPRGCPRRLVFLRAPEQLSVWLREPAKSLQRTRRFVCCRLHNVDSHLLFLVRILLLLPHRPFTSSQCSSAIKYLPQVKTYTKWIQLARKGVINNIIQLFYYIIVGETHECNTFTLQHHFSITELSCAITKAARIFHYYFGITLGFSSIYRQECYSIIVYTPHIFFFTYT